MKKADKQKKAIQELERAFSKCGKLDISFYGVDDDLHWSTDMGWDPLPIEKIINSDDFPHGIVKTKGAYVDSGGA